MIGTMKCVEFNKFMDYYKKKTHLSFYDYQNFMFATSAQQFYTPNVKLNVSGLYEEWQNEHEVLNMNINMPDMDTSDMDINTPNINTPNINTPNINNNTPVTFITIDFSLNTISDLIQIAEQNPIQEGVEYNINLKTIHSIKTELCELDAMIGMHTLKKSVLEQLLYYLQGLHNGADDYKHTVIFGPPGTGKTEVAKVLGAIYSKIGVINKPCDSLKSSTEHKFKKATRSDMIAGYLGQTAIKMKALITQNLGGVLFIDEAYSLGDDNFSKECVDKIGRAHV